MHFCQSVTNGLDIHSGRKAKPFKITSKLIASKKVSKDDDSSAMSTSTICGPRYVSAATGDANNPNMFGKCGRFD